MDTVIVAAEVENLHQFIQQWFNGSIPKTEDAFARLSTSWPHGFTLIDPHNKCHSSTELLKSTYQLHGQFTKLSIQIKSIRVTSHLSGAAVAVYEEWHVEPIESEARLCSATFAVEADHPGRLSWVHIHESKLAI